MPYQTIHINPRVGSPGEPKHGSARRSVLVIYTGGTFGMVYDAKTDQLVPFNFDQVLERVPEIQRLNFEITLITMPTIIDSSNMTPAIWVELARLIERHYVEYDSFVILHGTDTMAYTASALSFMLENLSKPVILTGAQLPIGMARTDARENFITALEIAAAVDAAAVDSARSGEPAVDSAGQPIISEVCIYFNSLLLRGNRATKQESVHFNAFASENYPHLAMAGVSIDYNLPFIRPCCPDKPLVIRTALDPNVTILKLFPGITPAVVRSILTIPASRGCILETYGAGNAPTDAWFLDELKAAIDRGVVLVNVSQCEGGRVTQGRYQTSKLLEQIGVVSGADITTEAAITKLMMLLAHEADPVQLRHRLANPICGEMSA